MIARGVFPVLIAGLVASAWAMLWFWSRSPYARYVDHGQWTEIGVAAAICRAVPGGDLVVPALLYASGWVLMIAAMMLPTTLPLLQIFRGVTARRGDAALLLAVVIAGYLGAWLLFGLAAHALDWMLRAAGRGNPWLIANGWAAGAAVIGAAGLFQFSALKYRCLERCRAPFGYIAERWRGRSALRESLNIGFGHGAFCVGCCWALMLLMFVVGTANLGWMLALAAVMAAEKNLPGGRRLSAPLGVALLAWALAIVLDNALRAD